MANETWNKVPSNLGSIFGAVPWIDRYQRIYDFLNDQSAVEQELRTIDQTVTSKPSFESFLANWETRLGFSPELKTILKDGTKDKIAAAFGTVSDGDKYVSNEGLIRETAFMQILSSKRPIVDLGVLADHGTMTHRVQWVMIGMWDRRTRSLGVGEFLADLYAGLATANARVKQPPPGVAPDKTKRPLWDMIFDSFDYNATHPEFLHNQFVRTTLPNLYSKWA